MIRLWLVTAFIMIAFTLMVAGYEGHIIAAQMQTIRYLTTNCQSLGTDQ